MTRAETAALLNRVLSRNLRSADDALPHMKTFHDNMDADAWYYLHLQEATNSHTYKWNPESESGTWTDIMDTPLWD